MVDLMCHKYSYFVLQVFVDAALGQKDIVLIKNINNDTVRKKRVLVKYAFGHIGIDSTERIVKEVNVRIAVKSSGYRNACSLSTTEIYAFLSDQRLLSLFKRSQIWFQTGYFDDLSELLLVILFAK